MLEPMASHYFHDCYLDIAQVKIANGRIQTSGLWCRQWPLSQLTFPLSFQNTDIVVES